MEDAFKRVLDDSLEKWKVDIVQDCAKETIKMLKRQKRDASEMEKRERDLSEGQKQLEKDRKKLKNDTESFQKRLSALDRLEKKIDANPELRLLRDRLYDEDPNSLLSFELSSE